MNDALTAALVAALLASPIGTAVGGRIYPASDVPPNVPFPRCYIAFRRPPPYRNSNRTERSRDRTVVFDLLFASRTQDTPQLAHTLNLLDIQAEPYVTAITCPNLVYVMRVNDVVQVPQSDDRNTYVVGGGQYEALMQEG